MLGGIVAVYFPTVCYWASKSCTSCETWYKDALAGLGSQGATRGWGPAASSAEQLNTWVCEKPWVETGWSLSKQF